MLLLAKHSFLLHMLARDQHYFLFLLTVSLVYVDKQCRFDGHTGAWHFVIGFVYPVAVYRITPTSTVSISVENVQFPS